MNPLLALTGAYQSVHPPGLQDLVTLSPAWRAVHARWMRLRHIAAQPYGRPTENMSRYWAGYPTNQPWSPLSDLANESTRAIRPD